MLFPFQAFYFARFIKTDDFDSSLRSLLKQLIGKGVAVHYTFYGVDSKKALEKTKVWDLITGKLVIGPFNVTQICWPVLMLLEYFLKTVKNLKPFLYGF